VAEVIEMGEGGMLLPPVSGSSSSKGRTASYGGGPAIGGLVQAYANSIQVGPTAGGVALTGLLFCLIMPASLRCALLVLTICGEGALFALWLSRWVGMPGWTT
jgi:hypothetical protein